MHDTALEYGGLFFKTYADNDKYIKVIDLGSQDVNGSLRTVAPKKAEYVGVDFADGKGVDIRITDPYKLPFEDNLFDVAVSSSCFEHSEFFWLSFLELLRVLKPEGLLYINVPSNGSFHRYPVDCWRFYPDSGIALQNWAHRNGLKEAALLESFIGTQKNDIWNDFVAVFIKSKKYTSYYEKRMISFLSDYSNAHLLESEEVLNFKDKSFDELVISSQETKIQTQETKIQTQETKIQTQETKIQTQENLLNLMTSSHSWKLTRPLRLIKAQSKLFIKLIPYIIPILKRYGGIMASAKKLNRCYKNEGFEGVLLRLNKLLGGALPSFETKKEFSKINYLTKDVFRHNQWRQINKNFSSFLDKTKLPNYLQLPDIFDKNSISNEVFFSILTPVYNTDINVLCEMLDSSLAQSFPYWEHILVDDFSSNPSVVEKLKGYILKDSRFILLQNNVNMGVSQTTNKALLHAKGRYIVLLDHDDLIHKDALLENLKVISAWPEVDMIYSDENKIDETGNFVDPYFKPDWSEINLFTTMYTGHLSVYKKDLVKSIGGFRSDFDGTQDYDLALRVTEKSNCIAHIPKILYHWRIGPNSTAGNPSQKEYVFSRQKAAIEESLVKRGIEGGVEPTIYLGNWHPIFMLPKPNPLISIVIPTASKFGVIRGKKLNILENCLQSIMNSTYSNVEIIISTNNNDAPMLPLKLDKFCDLKKISYKKSKFNLAEKINEAVKHASGEFVILLNDDVEVISPSWIESMVSLFALDKVGCVGAKLLFENETIQHAGVVFQETGPTHIMIGESDKNPGPSLVSYLTREVIAVTGACLMVRKKVFEEIGGFDENFPLNYNDIDFCLKVRELGYSVIYEPSAKLYHFESLSKEGTYSIELDNFIKKWGEIDDPFYNLNFDRSNPLFRIASENIYNYRDSFYEDWLDKETIERAVKYISSKDELFKNGPSFSIVTSAFNTERIFLLELAASIKNQKYPNFEWVIVDNGSTNQSTVETLEEIARDFKKVNLVKIEKNKGIIGGMRAGLENAISDYILPMDSDDLITCDALILLCAFIKDKNSPLLIYSDEDKCDAKSNRFAPFFKVDWDPVLFYGCCYVAHLCAINRKKALELGVYLDQLANGCHDWDTFLRFIRSGIVPVHMNEIIYSWRAHSTSTASAGPSVKPFTVNSQEYVLSQHIKLQGLSKDFKIEQNPLFEHDRMWRLRKKEHELPNIVFVISDQAGLNIQPHSSLMKLLKNYEYIEIDLFSDFQDFVNDNQFNDKSNVVVIDKLISIKDLDWLNEAVGLLQFFNDASVISATINSNNNKVVWAGGYMNYEFGEVSPYIDKSGFDSGYFGELFLQRSVDTFSPLFWISDFKRLRNANLTIKKSNSFATFSGEFARDISMEKNRIIISPFIAGYLINDDLKSYVAPSIKNSIAMEKQGYPRNRILVS